MRAETAHAETSHMNDTSQSPCVSQTRVPGMQVPAWQCSPVAHWRSLVHPAVTV